MHGDDYQLLCKLFRRVLIIYRKCRSTLTCDAWQLEDGYCVKDAPILLNCAQLIVQVEPKLSLQRNKSIIQCIQQCCYLSLHSRRPTTGGTAPPSLLSDYRVLSISN
jgi:hypothetical protein